MILLGCYVLVGVMEKNDDGVFDKDLKFGCKINEFIKFDVLLFVIIIYNICFF